MKTLISIEITLHKTEWTINAIVQIEDVTHLWTYYCPSWESVLRDLSKIKKECSDS